MLEASFGLNIRCWAYVCTCMYVYAVVKKMFVGPCDDTGAVWCIGAELE